MKTILLKLISLTPFLTLTLFSFSLSFFPSMMAGAVFGSVPHIVQVDDYVDTLAFKVSAFNHEGNIYRTAHISIHPQLTTPPLLLPSPSPASIPLLTLLPPPCFHYPLSAS